MSAQHPSQQPGTTAPSMLSNTTGDGTRSEDSPQSGCCAFLQFLRQLFGFKRREHQRSSCRCPEAEEDGGAARQEPLSQETDETDCVTASSMFSDEGLHVMELEVLTDPFSVESLGDEHSLTELLMPEVLEYSATEEQVLRVPHPVAYGVDKGLEKQTVEKKIVGEAREWWTEEGQISDKQEQIHEDLTLDARHFNHSVPRDSLSHRSRHGFSDSPRQPKDTQKETHMKESKAAVLPSVSPPLAPLLLRPRGTVFIFRSHVVDPPATLLLSTSKHENEYLYQQATELVVLFHVRSLPSAHVYLQLQAGQKLRDVPRALLQDAAQLCMANSGQVKWLSNVVVMYTLGSNLLMSPRRVGTVGYVDAKRIHRILVTRQDQNVMRRLNLTKRKVLSAKVQREEQKKARKIKQQQAEAKEWKRKHQQQQMDKIKDYQREVADGPNGSQELLWDTEAEGTPIPHSEGRVGQKRRARYPNEDEDDSEEPKPQRAGTKRCFPVFGEQRHVLQGCSATVENRSVYVVPARRGEVEGCAIVTGTPTDVDDAHVELKKLLCVDKQSTAAATTVKTLDGRRDGGKKTTKRSKGHPAKRDKGRKPTKSKSDKKRKGQ